MRLVAVYLSSLCIAEVLANAASSVPTDVFEMVGGLLKGLPEFLHMYKKQSQDWFLNEFI